MSDTRGHLRALAEALPAGSAVPVPREWLLELLEGRGDLPAPAIPVADLTVADLAARYGRNTSTVRHWLELGELPGAYRFRGREWRIPAATLEAFETRGRGVGRPSVADSAGLGRSVRPTARRKPVQLSDWRAMKPDNPSSPRSSA